MFIFSLKFYTTTFLTPSWQFVDQFSKQSHEYVALDQSLVPQIRQWQMRQPDLLQGMGIPVQKYRPLIFAHAQ